MVTGVVEGWVVTGEDVVVVTIGVVEAGVVEGDVAAGGLVVVVGFCVVAGEVVVEGSSLVQEEKPAADGSRKITVRLNTRAIFKVFTFSPP